MCLLKNCCLKLKYTRIILDKCMNYQLDNQLDNRMKRFSNDFYDDISNNNILNNTCSICLDIFYNIKHIRIKLCCNYIDKKILPVMLNCGHIYHKKCIDPWLKKHNDCPYCREKIIYYSIKNS